MNTKEVLISGLLGGLVVLIIQQVAYYLVKMIWPYDILALAGMRAVTDPIMMLFFVYPWVLAFCVSIAYQHIKTAFTSCKNKPMCFGFLLWLIIGLPSAFLVWSSMDYPISFTINSLFGSLIYLIALAYVIVKFSK
ncbi:MAG: hypothetical protein COT15_02880 [Candidatus Diapherotrites archaeon CG08_land_8_20_14_0_20_34_12]|nr:MAG: hypothetical protein COT15_02880 [Candidatus Diapherotrites archaeon CG08_land_8_20_14_0_20_34_12]